MYPVSEAFLQAVQENTRRYYWSGRITTIKGVVYEFEADDIVKGSGYISSQCCGSTEIELGTVYAAEMGITLFTDIDRYTLEDARVELFFHLKLADGTYEDVPMGIFEVSEANRTVKCLELKVHTPSVMEYAYYLDKLVDILAQPAKEYNLSSPIVCHGYGSVISIQTYAFLESQDERCLVNLKRNMRLR